MNECAVFFEESTCLNLCFTITHFFQISILISYSKLLRAVVILTEKTPADRKTVVHENTEEKSIQSRVERND